MAENHFKKENLEEAINTFGIELDENIKWDNEKLIKALGDFHMDLEPEKYTWGARYVQSLNTVMLCEHLKKFVNKLPENPLESEDWVAETKENGCRCILVYTPEKGFELFSRNESSSNYLNGNFTDKTLFINKGLISEPSDYKGKFGYRFVLDGEILMDSLKEEITTTGISVEDYIQSIFSSGKERARNFQKDGHPIKIVVFDVMYAEPASNINDTELPRFRYEERELTKENIEWVDSRFGKYLKSVGATSVGRAKKLYQYLLSLKYAHKNDMRRHTFLERRKLRSKLCKLLSEHGVPVVEVDGEDVNKIAFLEETLKSGGEGIICKNIYAPYVSDLRSSRSHKAALKVKQSVANMLESSDKLVEDFDVFISGANPPRSSSVKDMIGSLSCSIYLELEDGTIVEHEIANVTGIAHEWKRKMAQIDESGNITLKPEYLGKVISIDGLALTATKLKFQHATLKEGMTFKAKNPSDCVWSKSVLEDMVITRGK